VDGDKSPARPDVVNDREEQESDSGNDEHLGAIDGKIVHGRRLDTRGGAKVTRQQPKYIQKRAIRESF
jgi:hypothetical protein